MQDEIIKQGKFAFELSYISEQGARPTNEDTVLLSHGEAGTLLAVADGLGAHGGGDIASRIASEVAEEEYMKGEKITKKSVCGIFQRIDDAIVAKQTDELKMKTTLACVFLGGGHMYAAHLGDTRIYTFKNSKELCVGADHSVAYEEVMKNHGTLEDIRQNPNRHILKAALGSEEYGHLIFSNKGSGKICRL